MKVGIVFAAEIYKGISCKDNKERMNAGIDLLEKNVVNKLILSGGVRKRPGYKKWIGNYESAAKIMEEYVVNKEVNKEKLILEDLSEDTLGEFIFLKYGILEQKKINSGIIISHDYHAPRIFEMAEKVFGKKYNFAYFLIPGDKNKRKSIEPFRKTFEEVNFKSKKEVLDILFLKHPFYNHAPDFYRKELNKMIEKNSK